MHTSSPNGHCIHDRPQISSIIQTHFQFLLELIYLKNWSSSHGTPGPNDERHLRELIENEFEGSLRFLRPVMNAVGGRRLTHGVINMILQDAHSRAGPQIHVILLGDNNLRDGMESVDSFIEKCHHLVQGFSQLQKCQLVLVSILPCPKTKEKFLEANSRLRRIAIRNADYVSYLDLEKTRFFINGDINESLFYDKIHLKNAGAKILAENIFDLCSSIGTFAICIKNQFIAFR